MAIRNEKTIRDERTEELRGAIEHRATWFYLLLDEASNAGLEKDDFARKAIRRCGLFHGEDKLVDTQNLSEFADDFLSENTRKIFEMDVGLDKDKLVVEFNYCPLVAAWSKQTDDEGLIDRMCDLAMEGDRGIISTYDKLGFDLQKTIASGDELCRLVITKTE